MMRKKSVKISIRDWLARLLAFDGMVLSCMLPLPSFVLQKFVFHSLQLFSMSFLPLPTFVVFGAAASRESTLTRVADRTSFLQK